MLTFLPWSTCSDACSHMIHLKENYKEIKTCFLWKSISAQDNIFYNNRDGKNGSSALTLVRKTVFFNLPQFLTAVDWMIDWLRATSLEGRVLGTGFSLWNTLFSYQLVGGSWQSIPAILSPVIRSNPGKANVHTCSYCWSFLFTEMACYAIFHVSRKLFHLCHYQFGFLCATCNTLHCHETCQPALDFKPVICKI